MIRTKSFGWLAQFVALLMMGGSWISCVARTDGYGKQAPEIEGGEMTNSQPAANLPSGVTFMDSHALGRDFVAQRYRLSNGLTIIILEDPSAPLFSYHTWVHVGSRFETPGNTGKAHLFEHMMFKATKNHPDGFFTNAIQTEGGVLNAGTSQDFTFYHQEMPKNNLELVARLESDRFQNLILNDAQIDTERNVIKEERRFQIEDNIDGLMPEQLYMHAFDRHAYKWPIIGTMKDLDNLNEQACNAFYRTYYAPNNATIVVVGDVKTAEVLTTLQKYYGAMAPSQVPPLKPNYDAPQTAERRHTIKKRSLTEDKLLVGYHTPNISHPDRHALEVLSGLFVDGRSSRLYKTLVDDTKAATWVYGSVDSMSDPGLFKIGVTLADGRKAQEAERLIDEEIDKFIKTPVSERELTRAKNNTESYLVRVLKTSHYKAYMLGYYQTILGDYREFFRELEAYRSVSADDLNRVAKTYLKRPNRTVIVAQPAK